jgi:hypothetical protein
MAVFVPIVLSHGFQPPRAAQFSSAQDNEFLPGVRHLQRGGDDDRDDQQSSPWHEITLDAKYRADGDAGNRKKYGNRIHLWLLPQEIALRNRILTRIWIFC